MAKLNLMDRFIDSNDRFISYYLLTNGDSIGCVTALLSLEDGIGPNYRYTQQQNITRLAHLLFCISYCDGCLR